MSNTANLISYDEMNKAVQAKSHGLGTVITLDGRTVSYKYTEFMGKLPSGVKYSSFKSADGRFVEFAEFDEGWEKRAPKNTVNYQPTHFPFAAVKSLGPSVFQQIYGQNTLNADRAKAFEQIGMKDLLGTKALYQQTNDLYDYGQGMRIETVEQKEPTIKEKMTAAKQNLLKMVHGHPSRKWKPE